MTVKESNTIVHGMGLVEGVRTMEIRTGGSEELPKKHVASAEVGPTYHQVVVLVTDLQL